MKKVLLAIALFCFTICVEAQRVYFIYLQSEKGTPFFVKVGEKIHSSTASGYLILSSLKDSTYAFSVGYPANSAPEAKFSVTVNGGDRGFLIKNFEDGPGLFDLQTLSVTKAIASARGSGGQTVQRTDAFTKLLAQATDDASLLTAVVPVVAIVEPPKPKEEKPPVVTEEKTGTDVAVTEVPMKIEKPVERRTDTALAATDGLAVVPENTAKTEESKIVPPADSAKVVEPPIVTNKEPEVVIKKEEPKQEEARKEETKTENAEPFKRSIVTRRSESSTTEGFGLVFLDTQDGMIDTIRLLIPNPKKAFVEEEVKTAVSEAVPQQSVPESPKVESSIVSASKTSCRSLATDKDFLKLRKNMAAESNDDEMIAEARKYFKNKCFTTDQVRNLSALFLTNASKYQFFDAAYNHVSDMDQFAALGSEIKDEYYTKRFKALIGE